MIEKACKVSKSVSHTKIVEINIDSQIHSKLPKKQQDIQPQKRSKNSIDASR